MNIWFPTRLMAAIQRLRLLPAGLVAVLVVSCGGSDDDEATRYHSVAMSGELIDYRVDTTNLTYAYTITESQFGLTGRTGSGTLKKNADGSYTPSGAAEGRIVILPSGLMLGAVRERFGTDLGTEPIIGLKNPATALAALAGDYNHVQRGCVADACTVTHGTFRVQAAGAWSYCREGNLATGACTGTTETGTLESRSEGQWRMKSSDGTDIGTVMGFNASGQNVLIADLKDRRAGGFGIGLLVGGQQVAMPSPRADSAWVAATASRHWLEFTARGSDIAISVIDSQPANLATTFSSNNPWNGMVTTAWGEVGFMANAGVYMLTTPTGDVELGLELR